MGVGGPIFLEKSKNLAKDANYYTATESALIASTRVITPVAQAERAERRLFLARLLEQSGLTLTILNLFSHWSGTEEEYSVPYKIPIRFLFDVGS